MTEHSGNYCAACQQQLDALLGGRLDASQAQVAEAQLQDCPACRARSAGQTGARAPDARQRLIDATLAALQLEPCAHAEAQAQAFLADELPAVARQLMAAHLATCPACTDLLNVLTTLERQLPALACRSAPAGFTQRVVAATAGKVLSTRGNSRPAKPRRMSLQGLLQGLLQRPRFAAEAAYCCALVWSLVLGLPTLDAGLLQDSGLVLRELGATNAQLLADSGELLTQGTDRGKQQLQDSKAQLQALYEQGTGRLRETIERIEPTYSELFR